MPKIAQKTSQCATHGGELKICYMGHKMAQLGLGIKQENRPKIHHFLLLRGTQQLLQEPSTLLLSLNHSIQGLVFRARDEVR